MHLGFAAGQGGTPESAWAQSFFGRFPAAPLSVEAPLQFCRDSRAAQFCTGLQACTGLILTTHPPPPRVLEGLTGRPNNMPPSVFRSQRGSPIQNGPGWPPTCLPPSRDGDTRGRGFGPVDGRSPSCGSSPHSLIRSWGELPWVAATSSNNEAGGPTFSVSSTQVRTGPKGSVTGKTTEPTFLGPRTHHTLRWVAALVLKTAPNGPSGVKMGQK